VTEPHDVPPRPSPAEAPPASAEDPTAGALPVEPVESAISRLEEQLGEARDRHLRLAAEYDNFRKRAARERLELTDRAQAALVLRLLDVLDDLDRLAAQDLSVTGYEALHEALVLVDRKLRKELMAAGLERLEPTGEPFNPAEHEAVSVTAAPDQSLDHKVSSVFQAGYKFKGSLVRPARVQVYSSEG
jgi:molecular chaperone GrpE